MRLRSTIISCFLFLLVVYQSPQDSIRQHYQAAEAARHAGNLEAAESEYTAILGEGYQRLGRIYSARSDHKLAVTALEAAQKYRPNSPEVLVDLAIAYFGALRSGDYGKSEGNDVDERAKQELQSSEAYYKKEPPTVAQRRRQFKQFSADQDSWCEE